VGDAVIVSASPERFLLADAGGRVETRPIKGTRPRGTNPTEDDALAGELLASEKDRAEHVMIVDVLRNDISRVCEYGSVHVPELLALERHATVHHLVSTVSGILREDVDVIDLLHACFPGGSITGAPKIRAMEIIAELEPVARGVYCGAIGYVSKTGAMDTSIAIRTCVMQDGIAHFSAGGGVVADSSPSAEYDETIDKARAIMNALGVAI
jgi:para-aminobenzoate synthetase component I